MTELLQFVVPGPPVAKARARVAIRGGKVHAFTPKKTESYEGAVRMAFCAAFPGREPIDAPLEITVTAYFQCPKYIRRGTKTDIETWPNPHRPDSDNIGKAIADAGNGVIWRDDALITDMTIRKRYSDRPRVVVEIRRVG